MLDTARKENGQMIQKNHLRLVVDHFRAVNHADISIGDMTVLSGVNACGKSTIAHLVHSLVNLNRDYEDLACDRAFENFPMLLSQIDHLQYRLARIEETNDFLSRLRRYDKYRVFSSKRGIDERKSFIRAALNNAFQLYDKVKLIDEKQADRYLRSFCSDLNIEQNDGVVLEDVIRQWFSQQLTQAENRYLKLLQKRSKEVWHEADDSVAQWVGYPGDVSLYESEVCVYKSSNNEDELNEIVNIDHAFYIESPWRNSPSVEEDGSFSIGDGFSLKEAAAGMEIDNDLFYVLEGNIVEDPEEIEFRNKRSKSLKRVSWMYARSDGHPPFPLRECATGIKSLSILNFLYTHGCLGRKTLLIVDEPEAHLHPQWIVEYAKILVRLNRRLGVRLLITTHSPDMLNALRRVANVEEVPDLRFYLAEEKSQKPEDRFDFNFRDLGRAVEPIFKKFNVAASRIEAYPEG